MTKILVALNVLFFFVELATCATAVMGCVSGRTLVYLGALYAPDVLVAH